jgi:hypothetical protein
VTAVEAAAEGDDLAGDKRCVVRSTSSGAEGGGDLAHVVWSTKASERSSFEVWGEPRDVGFEVARHDAPDATRICSGRRKLRARTRRTAARVPKPAYGGYKSREGLLDEVLAVVHDLSP